MITKTDMMKSEQVFTIEQGHFDVNLMKLRDFVSQYWLNLTIILLLFYAFTSKRINFSLQFDNPFETADATSPKPKGKAQNVSNRSKLPKEQMTTAALIQALEKRDHNGDGVVELLPLPAMKPLATAKKGQGNEANLFENVSILTGNSAKSNVAVVKNKQEKCQDYVARFINVARAERQKFGIPVSITLAQGLLESDAGESRLTRHANNHFGIKTFNRNVPHVVMKDDVPNDKFKKYGSAWESYRDHSLLLMKNHYKHLQFLSKTDYAGWAKGLEKAGYATDRQYAEKLIGIIETMKLYRFDEA